MTEAQVISTNIRPAIGYFDKRYGVYAGWCQGKDIWVGLNDAPEEMVWKEAKKYCEELNADCEGWNLPTKEELMLIYINKGIINEALIKSGGKPLEYSWYWSSTETNSYGSWALNVNNGNYNYNTKTNVYYVRPVLAL